MEESFFISLCKNEIRTYELIRKEIGQGKEITMQLSACMQLFNSLSAGSVNSDLKCFSLLNKRKILFWIFQNKS